MSQSELAGKLGMREQQIQRYEAERYRSISLQNYRRVADTLGVELEAKVVGAGDAWLRQISVPSIPKISRRQAETVIRHARDNDWFPVPDDLDKQLELITEYIVEQNRHLGSPALLRTGINNLDLSNDLLLAVWRARVAQRAEAASADAAASFEPLDMSWVPDLIRLSAGPDGPRRAVSLLAERGVQVILEPQITGLKLDGAAFLVNARPVIAMTLRHDRVDNFWFTLLHELGHVFLHQQEGLASGFFDEEIDVEKSDQRELQANQFAGYLLIPPERWRISPARIAKSPGAIEEFARQLEVHPAIVFGRLRKERRDYTLFSDRLGSGQVRKTLLPS